MYYTTLLFVYRCFLSAGSPASCPSRSRVVEALCILLCEKYPHPRKERDSQGRRAYTSRYVCMYVHKAHLHVFHALHLNMYFMHFICRWRLVISDYNSVKARLFNSQTLLDAMNLTLYTINEATSGIARGARGAIAPPFFKNNVIKTFVIDVR